MHRRAILTAVRAQMRRQTDSVLSQNTSRSFSSLGRYAGQNSSLLSTRNSMLPVVQQMRSCASAAAAAPEKNEKKAKKDDFGDEGDRKVMAEADIPPPTKRQLWLHFFSCATPMVGFGFMDNMVMIQAGDLIDNTIGVRFGLKTLAAAACGQVISDVSGVMFGGVIDGIAAKSGLPKSYLSFHQLQTLKVKRIGIAGAVIGVIIGCTLGMSSLLFVDLDKADRERRMKKLDTLFKTVMVHGNDLIRAEHCTFWLIDQDSKTVCTKMHGGALPCDDKLKAAFSQWDHDSNGFLDVGEIQIGLKNIGRVKTPEECTALMKKVTAEGRLNFDDFKRLMLEFVFKETVVLPIVSKGIKGYVYNTKRSLNIMDVRRDRRFYKRMAGWDLYTGYETQSMLVCPVIGSEGDVLGLIEMVNKWGRRGRKYVEFDNDDEKMVEMLAHHCAIFIEEAEG